MDYYEVFNDSAKSVDVEPGSTSYFSAPSAGLDPRLFRSGKLISNVRDGILVLLYNHLKLGYTNPEAWTHPYLAGSGVSHRWAAVREPSDLDCLVSINYVQFRQSNQEYKGWSDAEIAAEINQGFRNELHPRTDDFLGTYELTFYVNVNSDITALKPYAAYSVLDDNWVVPPSDDEIPLNPDWQELVQRDKQRAQEIVARYSKALEQVRSAPNDALRINAETALANAVQQGSAMFKDIHESRKGAFSPTGAGYADFANYRWQAGKQHGTVPALKKLHSMAKEAESKFATETYGVELPDTNTLIRRAYRS
jgi:hypothetical protein